MKLVIATPLYPPDIAEPAPYVKELAKRLADVHQVTVVTYGTLPEEVEGVRILAVNGHLPLPLRLALYTITLLKASWSQDVIYLQNGPSAELPASLVCRLIRKPMVLAISDTRALVHAETSSVLRHAHTLAHQCAKAVVTDMPLPRPEILPFAPRPDFSAHEASWDTHLTQLEQTFV